VDLLGLHTWLWLRALLDHHPQLAAAVNLKLYTCLIITAAGVSLTGATAAALAWPWSSRAAFLGCCWWLLRLLLDRHGHPKQLLVGVLR
jgi:hypothetical protein